MSIQHYGVQVKVTPFNMVISLHLQAVAGTEEAPHGVSPRLDPSVAKLAETLPPF